MVVRLPVCIVCFCDHASCTIFVKRQLGKFGAWNRHGIPKGGARTPADLATLGHPRNNREINRPLVSSADSSLCCVSLARSQVLRRFLHMSEETKYFVESPGRKVADPASCTFRGVRTPRLQYLQTARCCALLRRGLVGGTHNRRRSVPPASVFPISGVEYARAVISNLPSSMKPARSLSPSLFLLTIFCSTSHLTISPSRISGSGCSKAVDKPPRIFPSPM